MNILDIEKMKRSCILEPAQKPIEIRPQITKLEFGLMMLPYCKTKRWQNRVIDFIKGAKK